MKGTIKSLKPEKSFGFIKPETGDKDLFFHVTGLVGCQFSDLNIGDSVSFEVEQSDKGPKAVGVTKA
ncbi:MAG: cold shock domain-containing protein [Patescibacteria group bacterium]|jgi:CspA family cold shock protein